MPTDSKYYVMAAQNPDRMLLYSMGQLPDDLNDSWPFGQMFTQTPAEPVRVEIREGFENKELLPFFDHPPLVNDAFLQTLRDSGVDNIIAFEAEIHSEDESIVHKGYNAINIVGLIRAAGPGTAFTGTSQLIDASIDSLEIDPNVATDLLMFRLAENTSTIVVHEKVKIAVEAEGFHSVVFREPGDFLAP